MTASHALNVSILDLALFALIGPSMIPGKLCFMTCFALAIVPTHFEARGALNIP